MERREEEEGPEAKWPRPSHGRKWDIFGERRQRGGKGEHVLTFGKKMAEKMQHCFGLQLWLSPELQTAKSCNHSKLAWGPLPSR